jgi:anti-sigma factor RsiW
MMKYMDRTINGKEAAELKSHIEGCKVCKADFEAYDDMMRSFDESSNKSGDFNIFEAPDDFVEKTMEKINALNHSFTKVLSADSFFCGLIGGVSLLAAVVFMLISGRERIFTFMEATPALSGFAAALRPFTAIVDSFAQNLQTAASGLVTAAGRLLTEGKWVFAGIALVLIAVQFAVFSRRKKNAEIEEDLK